jgi:hypothetical protein
MQAGGGVMLPENTNRTATLEKLALALGVSVAQVQD